MKKFIIIAMFSAVALVGCSSQALPTPTVTVTQNAPAPEPTYTTDAPTGTQEFINFIRENGGIYGNAAKSSDLVNLGYTVCNGIKQGLTDDEILYAMASALVEAGMDNDEGAKFGAALIVGSKNYLCGVTY